MNLAAVIGIIVITVVVVFLFPFLLKELEKVKEGLPEGTPESVESLLDLLPIVFMITLIIGAVAWLGFGGRGREEEAKPVDEYSKEWVYRHKSPMSLKERIEAEEQRK